MNPHSKRLLEQTGLELAVMGFGEGHSLANFLKNPEMHCTRTLLRSLCFRNPLLRYLSHGRDMRLSEHRFENLLIQYSSKEFLLSTEEGDVYKVFQGDPDQYDTTPWTDRIPFELQFEY